MSPDNSRGRKLTPAELAVSLTPSEVESVFALETAFASREAAFSFAEERQLGSMGHFIEQVDQVNQHLADLLEPLGTRRISHIETPSTDDLNSSSL